MNAIIPQLLKSGSDEIDPISLPSFLSIIGAGAVVAAVTVAAREAVGLINKTTINFTNLPVTVANTTGASFGHQQVYTFPEGRILVLGTVANLGFNWAGTGIGATGSGDFSVGTTATADATLTGTDVDLVPSSPMTTAFVAGVGAGVGALASSTQFDGTTTAKTATLNIIIDDAAVADGNSSVVLVSGTLTLLWTNLGDYTAIT